MTNDERNKLFGFDEECPNDTPEEELRVQPVKNRIKSRIKKVLGYSFFIFLFAFLLLAIFIPIHLERTFIAWWLGVTVAGASWSAIGWIVLNID